MDAIEEAAVFQIPFVAFRSVAANCEIEFHLDRVSANPQVFEARAQERHLGNMAALLRMLGGNLRHHAIGRDDFEYVQAFNHRRRQRHPARMIVAPKILFLDLAAGRTSVARLEGNQAFQGSLLHRLSDVVSAAVLQYNVRMVFDRLIDRMFQIATEHVGFGVIHVVPFQARTRRHR